MHYIFSVIGLPVYEVSKHINLTFSFGPLYYVLKSAIYKSELRHDQCRC